MPTRKISNLILSVPGFKERVRYIRVDLRKAGTRSQYKRYVGDTIRKLNRSSSRLEVIETLNKGL
jgi:hypothetical protein